MTKPINVEAYKRIHENSQLAFCIIELIKNQDRIVDFSFIYANPALSKLSKVPLNKLYEKPFYQLFPNFSISILNAIIKSLDNNKTEDLQMLIDNSEKLLHAIIYPIYENICALIILDYSEYNYKIKENQFLQNTLKEVRQANHIFTKVEKLFGRFVLLDFEKDTYQFLGDVAPYQNLISPSGKYNKLIEQITNMLIEDKEHINNILQKESLVKYFKDENKIFSFTIHIMRDDEKYENCNILPLKFNGATCSQAILTQQDITNIIKEREKNEIILSEALKSAKFANEAKSVFLSNISHDLRTPLNTILGMSTIAQMNINDSSTVLACLDKINIAGNHLLQIINQILDMAKIEKGKMVLDNAVFSIKDCIQEVLSIVSLNCKSKNISLESLQDFVTDRVCGDFLKLKRMLLNLLDNAIKYTNENGHIKFKITEKNSQIDEFACFQFVIEDDGIGMEQDFVKHIFEPFARAKNDYSLITDGAGLGMSIAQSTAHLMKGDIEVDSQIGDGTTITATIYLKKVKNKKHIEIEEKTETEKILPSKKILLVEDNDLNIEVAKTLLESLDHNVVTCKNGQEAINTFLKQNDDYFDIIFMDIRMPVMDGYQTSSAIRNLTIKNSKTIPIIAMTADAFVENIYLAKKSGMNDFLPKPISINEIKRILTKYLF
ncbi:MAG: hybrid sensor histidine kinase/response regulator [Christensenellales bacterium]